MDSVLGISVDACERNVKTNRKWVRYQVIWVTFNIALVLFDWQTWYLSSSRVTAISFGAMIVTALWSLFFLMESHSELRDEKRKLRFLQELKETHMASDERRAYLIAKNEYEQLRKSMEKNHVEGTQQHSGSQTQSESAH
jgi:hypothetical protein